MPSFSPRLERQDLVRLEPVNPAFEGIIRFVDAFLIHGAGHLFGGQHGKFEGLFTGGAAHIGVIADGFGNDVARALQGLFNAGDLLVEVGLFDDLFQAATGKRLLEDMLGQTVQALFTGDHGSRAALGLVGRVQIFQGGHRAGGLDGDL